MADRAETTTYTGRCYCGALCLSIAADAPLTVAYCHCVDCRRWTGAPLPAFAAFPSDSVTAHPAFSAPLEQVLGVRRWVCVTCGSAMAAQFADLPGQTYVPLGVLDQVASLPPQVHCHMDAQVPWLHLDDGLPRHSASGRTDLNAALGPPCP